MVKVKHYTFERKNGTTYMCKYMYKMLHKSPKHSLDQAGCRFLHTYQTLMVTSQPLYIKTNNV